MLFSAPLLDLIGCPSLDWEVCELDFSLYLFVVARDIDKSSNERRLPHHPFHCQRWVRAVEFFDAGLDFLAVEGFDDIGADAVGQGGGHILATAVAGDHDDESGGVKLPEHRRQLVAAAIRQFDIEEGNVRWVFQVNLRRFLGVLGLVGGAEVAQRVMQHLAGEKLILDHQRVQRPFSLALLQPLRKLRQRLPWSL